MKKKLAAGFALWALAAVGSLSGCSLVDGEFETQQVFGLFTLFLIVWGGLCLAERLKRGKG
ncbi:MAG TPA: hypothetical protein VFX30_13100 [bacterium]|nr:hypothetical protein [bacterium]